MEISDLPLHFDYVMHCGKCIPREDQIILTWSLKELERLNHFDKTYLWGILYGDKCDYYVAFGVRKDFFKGRTYYYSLNREEWVLLPKPDMELEKKVLISTAMLTGDPSYQLLVTDDQPVEQPPRDDEIEEEPTHDVEGAADLVLEEVRGLGGEEEEGESPSEPPGPDMLKEEDRVSLLVKLITEECGVVPRGALVRELCGAARIDAMFRGLEPDEALEFRSYFHLRPPRNRFNANLASRPDSDFTLDILDTIDDDVPHRKTWTIRNTDDDTVVIHNLTWPGMLFYHRLNTASYGFLYIGFGNRNLDLPFML